jgi:hypothetical protein
MKVHVFLGPDDNSPDVMLGLVWLGLRSMFSIRMVLMSTSITITGNMMIRIVLNRRNVSHLK